jgi:anti-sigma B factor antagonist
MIHSDIKTFGGKLAIAALRGHLVLGRETQEFRKIMQDLIGAKYRYVVIDLGGIEKIDCAGMGELIKCRNRANNAGTTIALQNLPRRVHDLLVITSLVALFDWCEVHILRAA